MTKKVISALLFLFGLTTPICTWRLSLSSISSRCLRAAHIPLGKTRLVSLCAERGSQNILSGERLSGIPVFDLQQPRTESFYQRIREACEDIGFFCITGHGIPEEIFERCRDAARTAVFDRPVAEKKYLAVEGMQLSRGWEMSPQHREYMHSLLSSRPFLVEQKHPEISAEEGIMTERFCIGPEEKNGGENGGWIGTTEEDAIFLHPNIWPVGADGARLRAAMTDCYARMEEISEVLLSIRPHFYFPLSSLIPRQSTRARTHCARAYTHQSSSPLVCSSHAPATPPYPHPAHFRF